MQRASTWPGDGRGVEVWDTARVVAGEPVALTVLAVGDRGRDAYRWRRLAQRWAGVPFWGRGAPPVAAIGTGGPQQPPVAPGHGPDGAPSWAPANRFVALPGSRGDRTADAALLAWAVSSYGPVDVALGHGDGGRQLQIDPAVGGPRVLLDGGLPLGPDADDEDLASSWASSAPTAVVVAADRPTRYAPDDVARFLARHPHVPWRRVGGTEHPGVDHDRLVDGDWPVMVLPGIVARAVTGRRL